MYYSLLAAPFIPIFLLNSAYASISPPSLTKPGGISRVDTLPQWVQQRRQILVAGSSSIPADIPSASSLTTTPSSSISALSNDLTPTPSFPVDLAILSSQFSLLPLSSPTSSIVESVSSSIGLATISSTSVVPSISVSLPSPSTNGTVTVMVQQANVEGGSEGIGGNVTYLMTESKTFQETSVGNITTHCLTSIIDPSEQFCRTLLNGAAMDGSSAAVAASTPSSVISSTSSLTPPPTSLSASPSPSLESLNTSSTSPISSSASALTSSIASPPAALSSTFMFGSWVFASDTASPIPSPTALAANSSATESAVAAGVSSSSEISSISEIPSSSVVSVESAASSDNSSSVSIESSTISDPAPTITSTSTVETIIVSATPSPSSAPSLSSISSSPTASVALAAAGAGSTETNNESDMYPGQKIAVLPIGLGVFGGLVGIALCIVGYMLYQRRLYRGQFVRRKAEEKALASRGAGMGYGVA